MVKDGIEFINAEPDIVKEYLETARSSRLELSPSTLKIAADGNILRLQVMNGSIREYPLRRTFLYKLLKWYNFSLNQIYRLSLDTIASICNDFLMNIKRDYVTIKLEEKDALTLLSPDYNEITDLEIIKSCEGMGITKISRNDFFLSITTEDKIKTEPIPGDKCGIGLNIVNSETGFRALRVSHYIIRYVCSNGAVAKICDNDDRKYHYGKEDLRLFLNEKVKRAAEEREQIIEKLKKLNNTKYENSDILLRKIESILGKGATRGLFMYFNKEMSQYQFFNTITSIAKQYDLSKRHALESLAGEMLNS